MSSLRSRSGGIGIDVKPSSDTTIQLNANRYRYEQYGFPAGFAYKGGTVALPSALDPTKQGYGQSWSGLVAQTDITDAKIIHHFNNDWSVEAGVLRQRQYGLERRSRVRTEDLDARFPGLLQLVLAWEPSDA